MVLAKYAHDPFAQEGLLPPECTTAQVTSAEARAAAAEARDAAAEHEDALQALALRTPPLGADRHHRTYWWPLGERLCEQQQQKLA